MYLYSRIACDRRLISGVANIRTKSIQRQVKSIDVDKVGSKKHLASNFRFVSCRINCLLISRSNLQASETECRSTASCFLYILYNMVQKRKMCLSISKIASFSLFLVTIAFFFNKQVVYRFSVFRIMPGIGERKLNNEAKANSN